jgi:hypothetical protein
VHVLHRLLADAVMLVHFGFLVFLAVGGFLAWRWPWVLGAHVAAVVWGALSVFVGLDCPLTAWEDHFRRLSGEQGLPAGFVDTYLTGVVYPREDLVAAQLLAVRRARHTRRVPNRW